MTLPFFFYRGTSAKVACEEFFFFTKFSKRLTGMAENKEQPQKQAINTNRKQMSFVLFMDSTKLEGLKSLVTTGHFTMAIGDADAFDESYFV